MEWTKEKIKKLSIKLNKDRTYGHVNNFVDTLNKIDSDITRRIVESWMYGKIVPRDRLKKKFNLLEKKCNASNGNNYISVSEFAELINVSRQTVYTWIQNNEVIPPRFIKRSKDRKSAITINAVNELIGIVDERMSSYTEGV